MKSLFPGLASHVPETAILLGAGLGRRMRPLTDRTAKPLLRVSGRSLLDHALDRLGEVGVKQVVVNAHWHADQIERRLLTRGVREPGLPHTVVLREPELLETGGGVLAALDAGLLDRNAPFFVVNGDSLWLDGPIAALARLADAFDPERLDVLLLVTRIAWAVGDPGRHGFAGDFAVDANGLVRRRREQEIVPYIYAGVQIVSPRLFDGVAGGVFSMNLLWDRAIRSRRLRALVHDGPWFHLSRPSDLVATEAALRDPTFGPPDT